MDADSAVPAGSYDLVLATGPPYEPFVLAERLARRHGCPYVLDYRDPWTGDPHWAVPHWQTRMEAALLQGARAVIIVSSRHAKALRDRFDVRCPVEVIRNGFDVSDVAAVEPYQFDDPAIVYAGTLHPPISVIDPIMSAIARIDSSHSGRSRRWSFHYYGPTGRHVAESANRWGVSRRVKIHGVCPRTQAMSAVRGAAVAVVITHIGDTGSDADLGIVTAKLFETIGLGTPVLLVSPPGSDAEQVLAQVNGGKRFAGSDIDGIAEYLMQRITSPGRIAQDPGELSWDHLGRRLDAVLRAAIAEHRACTP
jgi:glycosyltransferase involved in cell wall biosynthesis